MHVLLEVLVSLTALYIIFSIINSALVESISQLRNSRGHYLRKKIDAFFTEVDNKAESKRNLSEKLKNYFGTVFSIWLHETSAPMTDQLYSHPLIVAYKHNHKDPAYIEKGIFAKALIGITPGRIH